jgi:hypothetical protein
LKQEISHQIIKHKPNLELVQILCNIYKTEEGCIVKQTRAYRQKEEENLIDNTFQWSEHWMLEKYHNRKVGQTNAVKIITLHYIGGMGGVKDCESCDCNTEA